MKAWSRRFLSNWPSAAPAISRFQSSGSPSVGVSRWTSARGAGLNVNGSGAKPKGIGFGNWTGRGMPELAPVTTRRTTSATRNDPTPTPVRGSKLTPNGVGRYLGSRLVGYVRPTPKRLGRLLARATPSVRQSARRPRLVLASTPPKQSDGRRSTFADGRNLGAKESGRGTPSERRNAGVLTPQVLGNGTKRLGIGGVPRTPRRTAAKVSGTRRSGTPSNATPIFAQSPNVTFTGCWFDSKAVVPTAASLNLRPLITSSRSCVAGGTPLGISCGPVRLATSPRADGSSWSSATAVATVASPQPDSSAGLLSGEAAGCGAWSSPRTTQEVGQW